MLLAIAAAAAFIVSDGYAPVGDVAWLCPLPETAAEIGFKVDQRASTGLISALAQARKCVPWQAGTLKVRAVKHVGAQEIGLIRIVYGRGPEISYWVARNTVRGSEPDRHTDGAP